MSNLSREPRQARSRETLERIVAATFAIARTSLDGTFTLRAVADAAGIAQGTLHARFPSKDELLVYVHERFWEARLERLSGFLDEALGALATPLPPDALRDALRPIVRRGLALLRAELRESRALDQVFARGMLDSARLAASHRRRQRAALELALDRATRAGPALVLALDPQRLRLTARLVIASLNAPPQVPGDGLEAGDEELLDELTRQVLELLPRT